MLPFLISIPILSAVVILQTAVLSKMQLLQGSADLMLLVLTAWSLQKQVKTAWLWSLVGGTMVSLVSAMPFGVLLGGYLLVTALTLFLRQHIWKAAFLTMLLAVFCGTLILHSLSLLARWLTGASLPALAVFNLITLPSLLLNLLLSLPVYLVIRDLADWLHPEEIEA